MGQTRASRFALLVLWLGGHTVRGAVCDVGDSINAIYNAGPVKAATIVHINLELAPGVVTVIWTDGTLLHRDVPPSATIKQGGPCTFMVGIGQAFNLPIEGDPATLRLVGPLLFENNRVLIADATHTCGTLLATSHPAVSSPPGSPIGVVDMYFFEVVVSVAGSYQLCFWSGKSVNSLTNADPRSYATTLGTIVVGATSAPTSAPTQVTPPTTYSRRRGFTYEATQIRFEASSGASLVGISANPASWNFEHPLHNVGTCRTCQRYLYSEVDRELAQRPSVNRLEGVLVGATAALPGTLGDGCDLSSLLAAPVSAGAAVMLVKRGACTFVQKANNAAAKGYRAVLVANILPDSKSPAGLPDMFEPQGAQAEAPAWSLPNDEGEALRTLLDSGVVVRSSIEDLVVKPRLSEGLSDGLGVRNYAKT